MMVAGDMRTGRSGLTPGIRAARRRGLTLLEVLLSLMLMIVLLSGVFSFYWTAVKNRESGGKIARDAMLTRALLEQIAIDIRHTTDIVPGDGIGFRGERDSIVIVRTRMPELYAFHEFDELVDELPPPQMDLERLRYELQYDEELVDENDDPQCHGLYRSVQKTFDPNPRFVVEDDEDVDSEYEDEDEESRRPQIEGQLIGPEFKYFELEYFDGAEWRDQWQISGEDGGLDTGQQAASGQSGYALPQAVKVTLGQVPLPWEELERLDEEIDDEIDERDEEEEEHHPDRFTIVVSLLQADPSLISSRQYGVADQFGRQEGGR